MDESKETRVRIGQRITALRMKKGITQQQLADATGFKQPHIARIEKGKYSVGIDTIEMIANVLGCTVDIIKKKK